MNRKRQKTLVKLTAAVLVVGMVIGVFTFSLSSILGASSYDTQPAVTVTTPDDIQIVDDSSDDETEATEDTSEQ